MNPHKIMTYTESVNKARRSNTDNRLANLQAVTNAARRAHKNVSANEAIALYCGVHFHNLRSYKQCVDELGLTAEQIHTLPAIDIWGANSPEWCERTGAARFFPKSAFDCTDILKVDNHEPAADIPAEPMDNTATAPTSDLLSRSQEAEDIADSFFNGETPATAETSKTAKKRGGRGKKSAAPVEVATVDDLPF